MRMSPMFFFTSSMGLAYGNSLSSTMSASLSTPDQIDGKNGYKYTENLKSGFKKAGIHPLNRQKLLDRLAENTGEMFDKDLISNAFLDRIQKEREDFIGVGKKQRKKKLQVSPGDSISIEEFRKSRKNPGPSNETPQPKKKKKQAALSSSSELDTDVYDIFLSDSDDVDNLSAVNEAK
ncbi:hypothetical protein QTP88_025323 [Uroleucon formosanum]